MSEIYFINLPTPNLFYICSFSGIFYGYIANITKKIFLVLFAYDPPFFKLGANFVEKTD